MSSPKFEADELCATGAAAADDERASALAARINLPNPPGQWQLQVQILHWRGDPWIAGQRASAVMDSATSILRNSCAITAPEVSVSRITEQNVPGHPGQSLTAVISQIGTTPRIVHEYLVSDLRSNTVVELAMWSTDPPAVDWPTVNDDQLLAEMVAPLCTAYVNSCTT
ncbi:ATPase [Mycobacterium marinum]|uniref:ATPase n=1 Tax=Mycobacterium marinum TaxID=1781 RepID=UPI00356B5B6E